MNALIARSLATLAAGTFFLSRHFLPAKPAPRPAEQTRLESAQKLGDELAEPRRITKKDVREAKKTWGADSARMLELLRRSDD